MVTLPANRPLSAHTRLRINPQTRHQVSLLSLDVTGVTRCDGFPVSHSRARA
jgi:hypothetical protein